ncbi:hypothetical protein [Nocardioides euryhalodurans]|uniref:hypothetical protein n=1 Tax=Nocardioides euryhalodurans TaxID=2518370 RepID=UPI001FCA0769|nr:hypothetical protein [Nocardioides euryhalodurans]
MTALLGSLLLSAPAGHAAGDRPAGWPPVARATITPGVQMFTHGAQCTGNFVFRDRAGRTYVGYAAHCAGKGAATDTNGCDTRSVPIGTRVRFARGATVADPGTTVGRGRLAYSSWRTMRAIGESRGHVCAANDFALVRVARGSVDEVNPSVPFWGGPTGLAGTAAAGSQVHSYGSSSLRPTDVLSPKTGATLGGTSRGWGLEVYTATPGVPGDSGSGFLDEQGRAVGTLSTVALAPVPGSNGLGNLARELAYAQRHSGIAGLRLVRGTRAFSALP